MGSCSNRSDTQAEKIGKFAKKVSDYANMPISHQHDSYSDFQSSTGAEIRGSMGIEKGNAFIQAIKDAS